jgi:hypothetical protein
MLLVSIILQTYLNGKIKTLTSDSTKLDKALHKQYRLFRLTQPLLIITFYNTTCFDQTDHHLQVFILYKNLSLKVKM